MDLENLKKHLEYLDYPNIHLFSMDEVSEVFNSENRLFFVTWVVSLLETIPEDVNKEEFCANSLRDYGLCLNSEKIMFVKGDKTLDVEKQVIIITRILKFLKNIKEYDKNPIEPKENITSNDLMALQNTEIDFFPKHKPVKPSEIPEISEENVKKLDDEIKTLKKEILQLQREVDGYSKPYSFEEGTDFFKLKDSIDVFNNFKKKVSLIVQDVPTNSPFSENFPETVAKCSSDAEKVASHFQCLQLLDQHKNFCKNMKTLYHDMRLLELSKMIENIAKLSSDVVGNK